MHLKIKEINIEENIESDLNKKEECHNFFEKDIKFGDEVGESNKKNPTCRICLSTGCTEKNPLISPCNCQGSIKFIHLFCLKLWIKSKIRIKKNGKNMSIYWNNAICDLCHYEFPLKIHDKEKNYDLLDIQRPPGWSYILFEAMHKDIANAKGIFLMLLKPNFRIKIGKNKSNEIRVSDNSLSEFHAFFFLKENQLFLMDNRSRYGTYVLAKERVYLPEKVEIPIKVNNNIFLVMVSQKKKIFNLAKKINNSNKNEKALNEITNVENPVKLLRKNTSNIFSNNQSVKFLNYFKKFSNNENINNNNNNENIYNNENIN